jgi:pimeloyl-ACP methyl ester carboxylesterase
MRKYISPSVLSLGFLLAIFSGVVGELAAVENMSPIRESHTVKNGKIQLEAELVIPPGGEQKKAVAVFLGGSSAVHFQDYVRGFTEKLIEDIFLPRDISVLYFNKRGIGSSTGNWKRSSIEERAEDALAALEYLRGLPTVDPERIGVIGHSQGGWVAQLSGFMDRNIAFVISLAGPTVSVREQDLKNVEIMLRCEGYEGEKLERKVARRNRAHNRMVFFGKFIPFFQLRYMSNILPYDPSEAISGLTQPTLLAFAELDSMVPPEQNRTRFGEIFPNGAPQNITWHEAEKTDHMFRITDTICFDWEASLENPYSEEFRRFLAAWVDRNIVGEIGLH